jgi:hypothetical protein
MNRIQHIAAAVVLGAAAGFSAPTAEAAAPSQVTFDPALLQTVDETIMKMREETIKEQFAKMSLKDQLPNKMMGGMSQYASAAYRTAIQPYAVQGMMNLIRPYEFPAKFRGMMMPAMVPVLSSQIKEQQLKFMQEGVAGNPSFPNVLSGQIGK